MEWLLHWCCSRRNMVVADDRKESKKLKSKQRLTVKQLAEKHIISVGEARKLLGKDFDNMSDDRIVEIIFEVSVLGAELLKYKHFAR